jgi:hypothetical protein
MPSEIVIGINPILSPVAMVTTVIITMTVFAKRDHLEQKKII